MYLSLQGYKQSLFFLQVLKRAKEPAEHGVRGNGVSAQSRPTDSLDDIVDTLCIGCASAGSESSKFADLSNSSSSSSSVTLYIHTQTKDHQANPGLGKIYKSDKFSSCQNALISDMELPTVPSVK